MAEFMPRSLRVGEGLSMVEIVMEEGSFTRSSGCIHNPHAGFVYRRHWNVTACFSVEGKH